MPRLSKDELLEVVLRGLRAQGWTDVPTKADHPFEVILDNGGVRIPVRIYVWNVSHGGGAKRPPTEQRFQITGVPIPLGPALGGLELLCGVHQATGVLAVFDPTLHTDPSESSPSLQIDIGALEAARDAGMAVHKRQNGEVALAVRPDFLGVYMLNQRVLHELAGSEGALAELQAAAAGAPQLAEAPLPPPGPLAERQRVVQRIARAIRDARFSRDVLRVYRGACAICGTQLGLVEAAHIVPVAAPEGSDATENGLALCVLHHKAYDRGLIGIFPDYSVRVHAERLQDATDHGRGGGADHLAAWHGQTITLPDDPADRPHPELLRQGLVYRRWDV